NSVYSFGADWMPTSRFVLSARFGYWFLNNEDRGRATGIRYLYNNTLNASSRGLDKQPINSAFFNGKDFSNMSSNFQTLFNAYKRHDLHVNAAYLVSRFWGTHNFKGGYDMMRQANDVLSGFNTAFVNFNWTEAYSPQTSTDACNAIIDANIATYGPPPGGKRETYCLGNVGYFTVQDGVDVVGAVSAFNHGIYLQDGWTVGHGLTLNLGVRFDKEFLPPYRAGADHISFGFMDKVAPRIGGAYDLLHNGKIK